MYIVAVADNFNTARLQSCVIAQLVQQSRPHKAMEAVVNLLNSSDVNADAGVLKRQVVGAGRNPDVVAIAAEISGRHHLFDGVKLFVR